MSTMRKNHSVQTKVKVVLEAIKGEKTMAEITSQYGIHPTQINNWKKQALDSIPEAFSGKRKRFENANDELLDELYKQIGKLKVENEFLKKNINLST
jgi:transposase-like protein